MAQIDILKEVLDYSLRKFDHYIIGSNIYFSFNNERYAVAKLSRVEHKNEYDGISIIYVSKLFGFIDQCDIYFKDVFIDAKRASINVDRNTDAYTWFSTLSPTNRDLNKLAEHVDRYINLIGDFGETPLDYIGASILGVQEVHQSILNQQDLNPLVSNESRHNIIGTIDALDIPIDEDNNDGYLEESVVEPESMTQEDILYDDIANDHIAETQKENKEAIILESEVQAIDNSFDVTTDKTESVETDYAVINQESNDEKENLVDEQHASFDGVGSIPKETVEEKKGIFGFFKGNGKNKNNITPSKTAVNVNAEKQTDESSIKPFACWDVGTGKGQGIQAALYNIDKGNYSLVISGKGKMQDFRKSTPWSKYTDQITLIEISDGITTIGNNSFKSFSHLKSIVLPDSIETIGLSAFEFCSMLERVQWSKNLRVICDFAFAGTENLKEVVLPDSVEEIRDYAFDFSDRFVISCNEPKKLQLGAGINVSDFTKIKTHQNKFSAQNYML